MLAASDIDLTAIHAPASGTNIRIGTLYQDVTRPAFLLMDQLLTRHFAVLGSTGSGKSCTATLILSAIIIFLLVVRVTHAGGLWRDESAVVQLARMPAVSDIFHNFQHEAFPPLFPLIVRAYTILFGSTDFGLRIFGLCVGCLVVVAFWINARSLRNDVPLIALALTSLNTTFFVWGTTIRGYGLGSAMIVLTFGCICALLLTVNWQSIVTATLVCLFAVQILLYNSVLLLAIGGAAVMLLLIQWRFKRALVILAICAVAIVFLLPYARSGWLSCISADRSAPRSRRRAEWLPSDIARRSRTR